MDDWLAFVKKSGNQLPREQRLLARACWAVNRRFGDHEFRQLQPAMSLRDAKQYERVMRPLVQAIYDPRTVQHEVCIYFSSMFKKLWLIIYIIFFTQTFVNFVREIFISDDFTPAMAPDDNDARGLRLELYFEKITIHGIYRQCDRVIGNCVDLSRVLHDNPSPQAIVAMTPAQQLVETEHRKQKQYFILQTTLAAELVLCYLLNYSKSHPNLINKNSMFDNWNAMLTDGTVVNGNLFF